MFVVDTEPKSEKTIKWPVTVEVAVDGGRTGKYTFTGTFKLLDDDQREALLKGSTADGELVEDVAETGAAGGQSEGDAKAPPDAAEQNRKFKEVQADKIAQVMTDWSGVVDQDKNPIPFSRDNLLAAARSRQGNGLLRGINMAIAQINAGASAKN